VRTRRLAAWHVPSGPVGPPARWAFTPNVEGGSETEEGTQGPLAMEGRLYSENFFAGPRVYRYSTARGADLPRPN